MALHPASWQKEVTVVTVTLGSALSKSAIHPISAGQNDSSGALTALIICMILVVVVIARLFGGVFAPFKDVVKAAFAALGVLLLAGVLVAMLVTALVISA